LPSRNVRDLSFKVIFENHELFVEFLRDFVPVAILKDLSPADIEDVSNQYPSLEHNEKSSDTVKKINLKNTPPLFVIALSEHQSQVNFRMSFKLLYYMTSIWASYEKETTEAGKKPTSKDFRYPPILPLVFYDGTDKWTAETNFLNKVELNDIFNKYIPKFEYELIDLNKYKKEDLIKFGDFLSIVLLVDKVNNLPEDYRFIKDFPKGYIEKLNSELPDNIKELLAKVITALMQRINVPPKEIETVTELINQRRIDKMFNWTGHYDVQETRREARAEAWQEAERETWQKAEQKYAQKSTREKQGIADNLRAMGLNDEQISQAFNLQPK
jgi:hypothetical protein